jgi:hypothetical protein
MSTSTDSKVESILRLSFGFLLWAVSATLTLVLLLSMGGASIFAKILLGVVAVVLEGSKILSWRMGGAYRAYAIALIILSGIASLGSSLQVVEKSKGSFSAIARDDLRSSPAYLAQQDELRSIDVEISILVARLQALPADYTTAASRLESSLAALRDRKQSLIASLSPNEVGDASQVYGSMIALLGRAFGFRPEALLLVLLLFVSASIEVGALLLTAPGKALRRSSQDGEASILPDQAEDEGSSVGRRLPPSYASPITPEAFLEAAKDGADLPFIHGRDKTAEKLGISSAEAKRLVGRLLAERMIVVTGKRLRLVSERAISTPIASALDGTTAGA